MKQVPLPVIMAAKDNDPEAVDFVMRHFEGYMLSKSVSTYTDEYGGRHSFTDDDLYYEARNALFAAIRGFQLREPPEEFEG